MAFFDIFSREPIKKDGRARIIVDNRERNSLLMPELYEMNFEMEFEQLEVGDYIINNIVIERKTVSDLKNSIIDKRAFLQINALKKCKNSLLIVEGNFKDELYKGILHENAVRGFLLSAALEHKIPIILTHDAKDSARYFSILAKRKNSSEVSFRASKTGESDDEKIKFVLEGFPYIGVVKARELLAHFHSIKEIINAPADELEKVLGKRAGDFKELVERKID